MESSSEQLFQYREIEVTLPSGYVDAEGQLHRNVVLRELTGEEEDLLLDDTEAKSGNTLNSVLSRVAKLKDKPSLKFVPDLLLVDQLFLLVQARILTYGNVYRFDVTCQNQTCQKISRINLELDSLNFKGAPNPEHIHETVDLPSGISIKFKKHQGKDQSNLQKMSRGKLKDKVSEILKYRIVEMVKDGKPVSKDAVKSLPGLERKMLRDAMNKAEGNAETQISVDCVHCGHSMKVELPIDLSFFCLKGEED